ncbi:MAG: hypothetical protein CMN10_07010 [Roseobacter sp.]|nr:hypothetical protein [Roseobacter sp.]MBV48296.1 hypothetical protein [Roseobacter sp.]|tara:strand:+ start:155192 stop:155371 length:180 start_codon:yes stop_codon:yes gene_type:complete
MTTEVQRVKAEIERRVKGYDVFLAALREIIDRSNNGELGTSKVIDMRKIAERAIAEVAV